MPKTIRRRIPITTGTVNDFKNPGIPLLFKSSVEMLNEFLLFAMCLLLAIV